MAAIEKSGVQMAGAPSGLYFDWNMEKGPTDMAAAIAYTGTIKAPAGLEVISLPAAKSLTIDYLGYYDQIGSAHEAMEKYIIEKNLEALTPAVEAYLTDPMTEPDTAKWLTRVMYFVK
jgi:effector-binding domain-containing protein